MNAQQSEVLDSIRGLVRSIPRDIGMYASLAEGIEPSGETLVNVYLDEPAGPRTLQASTEPQDDELTITQLRDELLDWITERRAAA